MDLENLLTRWVGETRGTKWRLLFFDFLPTRGGDAIIIPLAMPVPCVELSLLGLTPFKLTSGLEEPSAPYSFLQWNLRSWALQLK